MAEQRHPVGWHYAGARERLSALLADASVEQWEHPVPACPGWRVRDVVAHLVGIIEDTNAGIGAAPPDDDETAVQVDRHRSSDPAELLGWWSELAPPFEEAVSRMNIWPAAFDALSHEHDVRGALDRPGGRDNASVQLAAHLLLRSLEVPCELTVDLGDHSVVAGRKDRSSDADIVGPLTLRSTPFEVLRFRLGRRSRSQVAALDWSGDPELILDDVFVFGPAAEPLLE